MNPLSPSDRDTICARIGALEWNGVTAAAAPGDGVLEATGSASHASPSSKPAECHATYYSQCRRPDETALEKTAAITAGQPPSNRG